MHRPYGPTRPLRVRLARFAGIVIGVVALGEGVCRLVERPTDEDLLRQQIRAKLLAPDAAFGWHLREKADETIDSVRYRVTAHGTRGAALRKDPSSVVIAGDADTMGWGVADDAAFPAQIERLYALRRTPRTIVNGGVPGYGLKQAEQRLEELIPLTGARTALLAYTPESVRSPEAAYADRWPSWSVFLQHIFSPDKGRRPSAADLKAEHDAVSTDWHSVPATFQRLIRFCREKQVACGVVLLPKLEGHPYPLNAVHQETALAATQNQLPVLDLAPAIAAVDPRTFWVNPSDEHPDEKLHARYAEEIFRWLASWQPTSGP